MKKLLLISLITLAVTSPVFANEDYESSMRELKQMQDQIFMPAAVPIPDITYSNDKAEAHSTDVSKFIGNSMGVSTEGMPLFKQIRIKITNHYKIKAHEKELLEQKILEAEEQGLEYEIPKKESKNIFSFFKKNKDKVEEVSSDVADSSEITEEKDPDTLELTGQVKHEETPKEMQLDCDVMTYYDDKSEIEAIGHPVLSFPQQNVQIKADRITYNTLGNIIQAFDNVEIIKDGNPAYGDYMQINMNEETSLITNLDTAGLNMTIHAKEAHSSEDLVTLEKGKMKAKDSFILRIKSDIIGSDFSQMRILDEDRSSIDPYGKSKIHIDASDIIVNAKKHHDIITAKDTDITFNNRHLFNIPSMTFHTNKNHEYFEANYPEFGTMARVGAFVGPGFVFDVPNGATVKAIPFLNYSSNKLGFGGALKYRSGTNLTELMYGTSEKALILRGIQRFDDKLYMQYGINSYLDNWWLGPRMAKYMAELVFRDGHRISNFMGNKRDFTFKQRVGLGYIQDTDANVFDEKYFHGAKNGTARLQYMANASQSLYRYDNEKTNSILDLGLSFQGAAAVYGTGDSQFIGRVGPYIHTQYKYWMQDINYFLSAYQDNTPVPRFDAYRYGHSNIYIKEGIRLCKYASLSWAGSLNLTGDSPNKEMIQENAFIIAVGPDDFKLSLGYDFIRKATYFGVNIALDTKGTTVDFDKMVIKNPDNLAKGKEDVKEVSFEQKVEEKAEKKTYAEVINIEDPERESIQ